MRIACHTRTTINLVGFTSIASQMNDWPITLVAKDHHISEKILAHVYWVHYGLRRYLNG